MSNLSIHLTKPNSKLAVFSYLIRAVERTKYSHVVMSWYVSSLDRIVYFEATSNGVNFLSKAIFDSKYSTVKDYSFEVNTLTPLAQYCHDMSGRPYGFKQMIGLAYIRLARLFGVKVDNPFKDGEYSQICLEVAARGLSEVKDNLDISRIEDFGLKDFERFLDHLAD